MEESKSSSFCCTLMILLCYHHGTNDSTRVSFILYYHIQCWGRRAGPTCFCCILKGKAKVTTLSGFVSREENMTMMQGSGQKVENPDQWNEDGNLQAFTEWGSFREVLNSMTSTNFNLNSPFCPNHCSRFLRLEAKLLVQPHWTGSREIFGSKFMGRVKNPP